MTRNGKIARLPHSIREELNRRLQDGHQGKRLVQWLNSLPETQTALKSEFGGRPVSEQNLSEWKQGGYQEWAAAQERCDSMRRLVEQSNDLANAAGDVQLSERLSALLTVELTRHIQQLLAETTDPAERWQRLQEALGQLARLRREESNAGRLQLEQERWQKKQNEAERRAASAKNLFPLNAAIFQYAFHQLIAESNPGAQAVVLQTLDRLTEKRRPGQSDSETVLTDPFKADQGKSRNAPSPNQTQSKPIQLDQTERSKLDDG